MTVPAGIAAVIGAGTMGAGISQVALEAGWSVRLRDPVPGAVDRGRAQIEDGLRRRATKRSMPAREVDPWVAAHLARLSLASDLKDATSDAVIVIEAIVEDLDAKRDLFADLDATCPADAILATNTSALSVSAIAAAAGRHPERVVGLHFFNPAPVLALVEVVLGVATAAAIAERATAIVEAWGKETVRSTDSPGFIVNRVNRPFTIEALRLVEAGLARVAEIDVAIRADGFPMGPFELMDLVGLDVNLAAATGVWRGLGRPDRLRPSKIQEWLVRQGRLGRKAGIGFYRHGPDRHDVPDPLPLALAPRVHEGRALAACGDRRPDTRGGRRGGDPCPGRGCRVRGGHRQGNPAGRGASRGTVRVAASPRPYNHPMTRDPHRPLREAWIVEAVRTPIGRYGGALAGVRPDDLAALVIRAVVDRSGIDASLIEDVILGCANQAGEDNRDVARMALLLAGLPVEVGGLTVNRLCGSGLQAINSGAHAIAVDDGDVFIGGGVESMTRAPYVMAKPEAAYDRGNRDLQDTTLGWRFINPKLAAEYRPYSMGETAENVVDRWKVSRERQDAFALASQQKALAAIERGAFDGQLVPVPVPQKKGDPIFVTRDEHPRADTTAEALARLRPAFREGGSVTAGNSSGINDGASAVLLVEAERPDRSG